VSASWIEWKCVDSRERHAWSIMRRENSKMCFVFRFVNLEAKNGVLVGVSFFMFPYRVIFGGLNQKKQEDPRSDL